MSVAIMADRRREPYVDQLLATLDADPVVVWDEMEDCWDTARRSWLAYDPDATHHLVIQDDAIVCPDVVAGLEEALTHCPSDVPVSLYLGQVRPQRTFVSALCDHARRTGASWIVASGPWWGVAVCVPTPAIDDMVAACDRFPHIRGDDQKMRLYFKRRGLQCWYTYPSLADHRDGDSLLFGPKAPKRVARWFTGDPATSVDWGKLPVSPEDGVLPPTSPAKRWWCFRCGHGSATKALAFAHIRRTHEVNHATV